MQLARFPRVPLAHLPTPLEPLPRLTAALGGPEIWVKRDDCTGLATGGNKTRKLEFLIADALAQGADTVITAGGVQSNHVRQTAAAAARHGLACELVLPRVVDWHDPNYPVGGNLLMDRLLGATVHIMDKGVDRDAEMAGLAERLAGEGRKPYVIPVGGSNPVGALGYANCAMELTSQANELGVTFDALIHGSGSGGTQAGLVVGLQAIRARLPVIGINDSDTADELSAKVSEVAQGLADMLDVAGEVDPDAIECIDGYVGPGYGIPTDGMVEALKLCAETEGLILDPVYSGKAMAGLIDLVRLGRFARGRRIVFLHTGGTAALSTYASAFDWG